VTAANIAALRAERPDHPTLARYATVGQALAHRSDLPPDDALDAAVDETARLVRDLRIPPLGAFGLTTADVPELVALARKASSMRYNPVVLSDEALASALSKAVVG
jgi:alcohol dehydrogenase class IV